MTLITETLPPHASVTLTASQIDDSARILGVDIRMDLSMDQAVDIICDNAAHSARTDIAFVNADCLNIACSDTGYREILAHQHYVLPDGIGVRIAGCIQGKPPLDNLNGTDMLPVLCRAVAARGQSIYLLGAKPGIGEKAKANLEDCVPGLNIVGVHHGYLNEGDHERVVEQINASGADILLVAFGAPLQEKWLATHGDAIGASVRIGVGGLFDFYSGTVPRAPRWMRRYGLEWLFRLSVEPHRLWRRYIIGNPVFLVRIFSERLGLRRA